ncbi:MAG TPA: hypothetical protein VK207_04790 [Bacteroidales bacterium]|nr:hypothetical protein [Bacteroidales bacterium]
MDIEKQMLIAKGTFKHLPGIKKLLPSHKTAGTIESRYCYTVWLRHLKSWGKVNSGIPLKVAELGPGDSLGTGFAALLSGSMQMYAFDVEKYWDNERNVRVFNELVELFHQRADLPDHTAYPKVRPAPSDFGFPGNILTNDVLKASLDPARIEAIRHEIMNIDSETNTFIKYKIPWHDPEILDPGSIDFIYSQAVLECIDDLENTYRAMCRWLKSTGLMSHTIDFKSHGLTMEWNGHWKFSDHEWFLVKGGRSFLINRQPVSGHLELLRKFGFEIIARQDVKKENRLDRKILAERFRGLSDEDLKTSGTYLLSKKGRNC